MALTVKHAFVSAVADDPAALAAGEVLPQAHWNASHTLTGSVAFSEVTGSVAASQMPALTGDITSSAGTVATTLATVNTNTGSWGLAGSVAQFTVNGKGLIIAAANVAISIAVSAITGLGTGVATALGINVGTAGSVVVNGGALGTPSSGTLSNCSGYPASAVASGAALTKTDDTNVTLTLGGTPATALLAASSLTLGWTGTLAASRGGTGLGSLGTGVATALGVNVGTAGAFVVNGGALGTPSSGTLSSCTGYTAANVASGAALTRTNDTNVTLTLGGTPSAALIAAASITAGWTGTLAVSRGGLGNASGANWAVHALCGGI